MTFLQIINKVLVRLRERQVSTWDQTSYSEMVGGFVNDAKSEIEDMWLWGDLRFENTKSVYSGNNSFDLTDLDFDSKVIQIWNTTTNRPVTRMSGEEWRRLKYSGATDTGDVCKYAYNGATSTDSRIEVYPIPTQTNVLTLDIYKPQAELDSNNTICVVPARAVYLKALSNLIEERGEVSSSAMSKIARTADRAVNAAIARDAERYPLEIDWRSV